jgi:hypothetical protein
MKSTKVIPLVGVTAALAVVISLLILFPSILTGRPAPPSYVYGNPGVVEIRSGGVLSAGCENAPIVDGSDWNYTVTLSWSDAPNGTAPPTHYPVHIGGDDDFYGAAPAIDPPAGSSSYLLLVNDGPDQNGTWFPVDSGAACH